MVYNNVVSISLAAYQEPKNKKARSAPAVDVLLLCDLERGARRAKPIV